MIKEIITNYDELSNRSEEIADLRKENELLRSTILDLKDTINAKNLNALSAPQIGVFKRVVVLKFGDNDLRTFINPIVDETNGFILAREKCPSLPDSEYIRPRNGEVSVIYQTPLGKVQKTKLNGLASVVMQEAIDHLEGVLLSDIGLPIDSQWDSSTDEERSEVLKLYCDSLDIKQKEVQKVVEQSNELKEVNDAINFMNSVRKGETKVVVTKLDSNSNSDKKQNYS